jgi:hypothetical protein
MPRGPKRQPDLTMENMDEPLTLGEIDRRYDGKWVLTRVTENTPLHSPAAGYVVATGTNSALYRLLRELLPNREPGTLYYMHQAGPWIRSHADFERYQKERATTEDTPLH